MKTVLLLGGPADGERYTIEEGLNEFRMRPRVPVTPMGTPDYRPQDVCTETWYVCHKLYDGETIYHVATMSGDRRTPIELLLDGYRKA